MTTIYITRGTELPERIPFEHYATERALIRATLESHRPLKVPQSILDPGAGDGRWGQVAREFYPRAIIDGVEIRDLPMPTGFDGWWQQRDFLTLNRSWRYDLIIGNPPYGPKRGGVSMAECFIRHAWKMLAPGGTMMFLLRLAFQAGAARYEGLWMTHPLYKLVVLSCRPSFYGGGTNGTDYGLFIWRKCLHGEPDGEPRRWPTELLTYERDEEARLPPVFHGGRGQAAQ